MFDLMNLGSVLPYVPTPEIHIDNIYTHSFIVI